MDTNLIINLYNGKRCTNNLRNSKWYKFKHGIHGNQEKYPTIYDRHKTEYRPILSKTNYAFGSNPRYSLQKNLNIY
jgi:hypothetical protein